MYFCQNKRNPKKIYVLFFFPFQILDIGKQQKKIKMNKFVLLSALFVLVSSVCANPLPQDLTIAEFRSLRDEETPSAKVFISPSYTQV